MTHPEVDTVELTYEIYADDLDKILALGDNYVGLVLSREEDERDNGEVDRYHQKVSTCDEVATKIKAAGGIGPVALYGWEYRFVEEARAETACIEEHDAVIIPLARAAHDLLPA